ncbi:MAG TPA: hypothetical protein VKD91_11530 [Pyrinomonadaceae bacterium]|nr:hypothetical protein [Pyrinomonadaceae bacterium]
MTTDWEIFEQIKLFLPKYLTPAQTEELYSELKQFPTDKPFYLTRTDLEDELLQGDGWRGFVVINFFTGERRTVSGVIISNSCDIFTENERALETKILFAPLIKLSRYIEQLRAVGKSEEQIRNIITDIRRQHITKIFYLPGIPERFEESIILFDDIHNHPLTHFVQQERTSIFTLNQVWFYIFLLKLSIHFSRFQEGVQRFENAA